LIRNCTISDLNIDKTDQTENYITRHDHIIDLFAGSGSFIIESNIQADNSNYSNGLLFILNFTSVIFSLYNCMMKINNTIHDFQYIRTAKTKLYLIYAIQFMQEYIRTHLFKKHSLSNTPRIIHLYNRMVHLYNRIVQTYNRILHLHNRIVHLYNRILQTYNRILHLHNRILFLYNRILQTYNRILHLYNRLINVYNRMLNIFNRAFSTDGNKHLFIRKRLSILLNINVLNTTDHILRSIQQWIFNPSSVGKTVLSPVDDFFNYLQCRCRPYLHIVPTNKIYIGESTNISE
jgi:hypothetical protein